MPRLTAAQRAVQGLNTVSRSEAGHLTRSTQQIFVHTGQERYTSLSGAVGHAGLDHALTLVDDRRSLRVWLGYLPTTEITLQFLLSADPDGCVAHNLSDLRPGPAVIRDLIARTDTNLPPLLRAACTLAARMDADINALADNPQHVYAARPAGDIRSTLTLLGTAAAAVYLANGDPPSADTVRQSISNVLYNPRALLKQLTDRHDAP